MTTLIAPTPTTVTRAAGVLRCPLHPDAACDPTPGGLACTACGTEFAEPHGIPDFVPPDSPEFLHREAEQWDAQAAVYETPRLTDPFYMLAVERAARELAPRPGELVLDAGCGTGLTLRRYWRPGVRVVALDLSLSSLRVCQQTGPKTGMTFVRGDLTRLPFADHTFDRVCCANAIQQLPGELRRQVVRELARVTKPGGRVVVSAHNYSRAKQRAGWRKEDTGAGGHTGAVQYIYRFDADEFRALLATELSDVTVAGAGLPLLYKWKLSPVMRVIERVLARTAFGRARANMLVGVGRRPD